MIFLMAVLWTVGCMSYIQFMLMTHPALLGQPTVFKVVFVVFLWPLLFPIDVYYTTKPKP